jgi:glycosyltransferase involved in cell wall biosynthesis
VIAFHGGGALDTVVEGLNGFFFSERTAESLMEAVKSFEEGKFDFQPAEIRAHAFNFDKEVFKEKIERYVLDKYAEFEQSCGERWKIDS